MSRNDERRPLKSADKNDLEGGDQGVSMRSEAHAAAIKKWFALAGTLMITGSLIGLYFFLSKDAPIFCFDPNTSDNTFSDEACPPGMESCDPENRVACQHWCHTFAHVLSKAALNVCESIRPSGPPPG